MTSTIETRRKALDESIARAGGIVAFSNELGVAHQAVYAWKRRGSVPAIRALAIEQKWGTPREELVSSELAEVLQTPTSTTAAADLL